MKFPAFLKSSKALFLCLWLLIALVYAPAYKGGFYNDFLGYVDWHRSLSFTEFIKLVPGSMYQGVNLFHYTFISLFGLHRLPWFLLFTGLHAFCGIMILVFFNRLFRLFGWPVATPVAAAGILIWYISPLAAEVINWKACSHYMVSVAMMFGVLSWLIAYAMQPRAIYLWLMGIVYLLSAFFLEIFYVTPILALIIICLLRYGGRISPVIFKKLLLGAILPLVGIWCCYYAALYFILGMSSARVNLAESGIWSLTFILQRLGQYTARIYLMADFWPQALKQKIYGIPGTLPAIVIMGVLLTGITLAGLLRFRKMSGQVQLIFLLFLLSYASCVIILPMWFYDTFLYQGTRYYYFPSIFFYMMLSALVFYLFKAKQLRYGIVGLYLLAELAGTAYMVRNIYHGQKIADNLLETFKWHRTGTVLLLDIPCMYRGINMLGAEDPSEVAAELDILQHIKTKAKIYDVSSFHMITRWDGAHVQMIDSMQLKVTLNKPGAWWWYKGFGAADYENDLYKVTFVDNGFSYLLQLKKEVPDLVILYQAAGQWKEVDRSKRNIEQW